MIDEKSCIILLMALQKEAVVMESEFKRPGYLLEEDFKKALSEVPLLSALAEKECYIGELADVIAAAAKAC